MTMILRKHEISIPLLVGRETIAKGKQESYVRHAASSQPYEMMEAYEYINKHWSR